MNPITPSVLDWRSYLIAALALGGALFAATYHLTESPGIWFDEGFYTQAAMNLAESGTQALQTTPGSYVATTYVTVGYPLLFPVSVAYRFFGVGVVQGRSVMVLFILGTIIVSFLFVKRRFGIREGALAALLLASFPMLYGDGKSVLGEVPGFFFLLLSLSALDSLERSAYRDWRRWAALGAFTALCAVTKPIYLPLPFVIALTLLYRFRRSRPNPRHLSVASVAFFVPVVLWMHLQFGSNVSLGALIHFYTNPSQISITATSLFDGVLRFARESTPLYALLLMIVWASAFFVRRKSEVSSTETSAFLFSVFILFSFIRLPDWYRYLLPALLTEIIFFVPSARALTDRFSEYFPSASQQLRYLAFIVLAVLVGFQVYCVAFDSYVAQYYGGTRTHDLSVALHALPSGDFFLYNVPELAVLLPSREYRQFIATYPEQIGASQLPSLTKGVPRYVLATVDEYDKHRDLFSAYTQLKTADQYVLLEKASNI